MPLYTKRIFKCKDSNIFQLNTFFVILFSHFQQKCKPLLKRISKTGYQCHVA